LLSLGEGLGASLPETQTHQIFEKTQKVVVDGWAFSKTQLLRCFQIIQGMSKVTDARPLCMGLGMLCLAVRHQSTKVESLRVKFREVV
jgi:hypothetical protein